MNMTLDEAIQHLTETLEDKNHEWACEECREEHQQLKKWLKELKDRREGHAACEYCEYETRSEKQYPCVSCKHNFTDKYRPKKKTTSGEEDWYDIPAEEMTKEQAQKAVKELRKALLEARTEAIHE